MTEGVTCDWRSLALRLARAVEEDDEENLKDAAKDARLFEPAFDRDGYPRRRLTLNDEFLFREAAGMAIGVVADTGNLRIIATDPDGRQRPIELQKKWLRGHGGLVAFVKSGGKDQEADR